MREGKKRSILELNSPLHCCFSGYCYSAKYGMDWMSVSETRQTFLSLLLEDEEGATWIVRC